MQVKLISVTQPLIEGIKTAEELIVYCARVSNPSNQLNTETGPKLINYCIKNKHWSIFEQASLCVEIKTSRAIAAQILRHKSFSFQEFSQRYATVTKLHPLEWRLQGKTNRQVGDEAVKLEDDLLDKIDTLQDRAIDLYDELIQKGVAKECARMILPLNTETTLYMNGTIRSWLHYFEVRCDTHTQKEHRDIALAIRELFKQQFPVISAALNY
jgi:thymidylate synthase (FAD)